MSTDTYYVRVYFDLLSDDDDDDRPWNEWEAYRECERILDVRLSNEGHFGDALVCCFNTDDLDAIRARLRPLIGGGDDMVFLSSGGWAQSFGYTERPGIDYPTPLFDDE